MIRKQWNVNKILKCSSCPNQIGLYEPYYREKQQAPNPDKVYCKICGRLKTEEAANARSA